jgi:hypothetical protein
MLPLGRVSSLVEGLGTAILRPSNCTTDNREIVQRNLPQPAGTRSDELLSVDPSTAVATR